MPYKREIETANLDLMYDARPYFWEYDGITLREMTREDYIKNHEIVYDTEASVFFDSDVKLPQLEEELSDFENAKENDVKVFLLGTGFGLCMILRNNIAIHGGAVCRNNTGMVARYSKPRSYCEKVKNISHFLLTGFFLCDIFITC